MRPSVLSNVSSRRHRRLAEATMSELDNIFETRLVRSGITGESARSFSCGNLGASLTYSS